MDGSSCGGPRPEAPPACAGCARARPQRPFPRQEGPSVPAGPLVGAPRRDWHLVLLADPSPRRRRRLVHLGDLIVQMVGADQGHPETMRLYGTCRPASRVMTGSRATTDQPRRQNSPVSCNRSRIAWFSSRVCGRHVGERRSFHHACASSLSFATEIVTPGLRPLSQRSTCSSDRKRFIVLQVKTMSSHHAVAGTRQWNSSDDSDGCWSRTSTRIASPQSGQHDSISPST